MTRRQSSSKMPQSQRNTSQMRQLYDINNQVFQQNQRIKNMHKVALQTQVTTNNIGVALGQQKQVILKNIDMNKEIKQEIKKADKKTSEMLRRNICIKFILWIVVILLFFTNIGLIIWKAKTQ